MVKTISRLSNFNLEDAEAGVKDVEKFWLLRIIGHNSLLITFTSLHLYYSYHYCASRERKQEHKLSLLEVSRSLDRSLNAGVGIWGFNSVIIHTSLLFIPPFPFVPRDNPSTTLAS